MAEEVYVVGARVAACYRSGEAYSFGGEIMESNVWTQWFVQVVNLVSRLFVPSSNPKSQNSGGSSPNVPANVAVSTLTSSHATILAITRDPKKTTKDALFGVMTFQNEFIGYTMERTAVAVPEGTYRGSKRDSAHFGMRVVGIDVPGRTNIESHPANLPSQLEGCVAVGSSIDNDALDNSIAAFDKMMLVLPQEFTVVVSSNSR